MKRSILIFGAMALIITFLVACQSGQTTTSGIPQTDNVWVNASNQQLSNIPVTGFGYKSSAVPSQSWDKWATASAPVVKGILNKMPDGYVLQVTGHTDSRGPEYPVGNKPGNMKISKDRARAVHGSLRAKGITSKAMTYKGVGSSMPLPGVATDDAQQRRVSFMIVPEGN